MCIRHIYELINYTVTQVHIVRCWCDRMQLTLGTRHTDRADMQFKVVFLAALNSVNTI